MTFNVMKIVSTPVKEQPYLPSSLRPILLMTSVDTVSEVSREITARPLATAGPVHEKDSLCKESPPRIHCKVASLPLSMQISGRLDAKCND